MFMYTILIPREYNLMILQIFRKHHTNLNTKNMFDHFICNLSFKSFKIYMYLYEPIVNIHTIC